MADIKEHPDVAASEVQTSLADAQLQIGDLVQLQSHAHEDARFAVRLIGMSKGRSVLVTTPMVDGTYLLMREGQPVVVRAFSGKRALAFSTHILKSVHTPYPYLHLDYPRHVKTLVVRKGARADVRIICAITRCDDVPMQAAGTILNISIGGALMATRAPPGEKGQRIVLYFKVLLNGIEVFLELNAIIRAINIDEGAEPDLRCHLGLQFVDVSAEALVPLLAYVSHELLGQSRSA